MYLHPGVDGGEDCRAAGMTEHQGRLRILGEEKSARRQPLRLVDGDDPHQPS